MHVAAIAAGASFPQLIVVGLGFRNHTIQWLGWVAVLKCKENELESHFIQSLIRLLAERERGRGGWLLSFKPHLYYISCQVQISRIM